MRFDAHDKLSASIAQWAEAYLPDDVFASCIAHGARGWVMAAKLKQLGTVSGIGDWLIIDHGRPLMCELKTGTGTLRTAQRRTRDKILRAGGQFAVVHSLEEFIGQLRAWGVPILDEPRGDPGLPADSVEDLWA